MDDIRKSDNIKLVVNIIDTEVHSNDGEQLKKHQNTLRELYYAWCIENDTFSVADKVYSIL